MSVTLRDPHERQYTWVPCPYNTLAFAQTHIPWIPWYHPTVSSSVVLFSYPPAFPASGSSPCSRLFALGGQSIGASAAVLAVNIQGWSPLGLTDLISLLPKGLSRVFSSTTVEKLQLFGVQPSSWSQLSHPYMTTGRTRALTVQSIVIKVISLPFNMLSRVVIAFLPRSSSVQFSRSVISNSLQPHGLQQARPPCPSPTPGV